MPTAMNFNVAADRELSDRLLAGFDMARGDLVLVEETTRTERRRYIGSINFAWVTDQGDVHVTITGKSGWAPGGSAPLLCGDSPHSVSRVVRKLDADDRALLARGGHWSYSENHPLNSREVIDGRTPEQVAADEAALDQAEWETTRPVERQRPWGAHRRSTTPASTFAGSRCCRSTPSRSPRCGRSTGRCAAASTRSPTRRCEKLPRTP